MSILFGTTRWERRAATWPEPPIPPNSATGVSYGRVDLSRTEASLQKVAVWSCVNLIATIAEVMPFDVYTGEGEDRRQVPTPSWLEDLGGDGHGTGDWLYQYVFSQMLRGNAFGLVADRDPRTGKPTQIVLQHPDEVSVWRDYRDGLLRWRIAGEEVPPDQIWHQRVFPIPGYPLGLSPISMHALTIGVGIAAQRFGAQWFEDGAHPSGLLTNEEKDLDQKQARTAKERFLAALRGTREPVVLGRGWKYQQIQIAPNESQFLETMGYTAAECCRIFGPGFAEIFGYETGGSLTYSNVEQRSLDFLTYAADPWLVRVERMLSSLLPRPREVRFNRGALVRTDLLSRYRAHEIALRNQWMTVNEVRELEDLRPVPWGDEPNTSNPGSGPTPARGVGDG